MQLSFWYVSVCSVEGDKVKKDSVAFGFEPVIWINDLLCKVAGVTSIPYLGEKAHVELPCNLNQ